MDWGSLITSILPTIGGIVGSLLGANRIEDGVIHYQYDGVKGAQEGFSSAFCCEDGKYYLFNQSTQKEDTVVMTFPARGQIGAETCIIPGRMSLDVTAMFEQNAVADNDCFELTACSQSSQVNGDDSGGIKIASSGRNIPVGGEVQAIGTFLDAKVEQQQITITPKNGIEIQSLPVLSVQSSGDICMRVMDAAGEGNVAVVPLPQPLEADDYVSVDVTANVTQQSVSAMLQLQRDDARFAVVSDAMAERIKNAPRLNWRK